MINKQNIWILIGSIGWIIILAAFISNNEPKLKKTSTKINYVNKNVPVIHEVIGTLYNPVSAQCDADPLITADNSKIDLDKLKKQEIKWCALSRDLLKRWGGPYNYGDTLRVHHPDSRIRGTWIVHDTMNKRFRKRIDFLVHGKHNIRFPHKTKHILISNTNYYVQRE